MAARTWTQEQRRRQAEKIKLWQPWRQSTGPRTEAGKARASRNAYKDSPWRAVEAELKAIRAVLREQRQVLHQIKG